jgi:serine/threonine-protein kinase
VTVERLAAIVGARYEVHREIGRGGMATVYLAHDVRHDRDVAIKLLRPELSAVLGADRFLNEIKVTAQLQHPHILPLYDSGTGDGLLYYVMPFVEGESLRRRLERERQLPIVDAIRVADEVADALDYAHRHGVIHRDIKPENILLHEGRVMVADFGIALAVQKAGGARITETGLSLGTPQYMSPEQATAERELDGRSDIYSLGCVLYEMLAGETPHSGPTTQAIIAKILTDKPRPIGQLRESVPQGLAVAVHTAIAKLAADRYGTAGEFRSALGRPSASSPGFVLDAGTKSRRAWTRQIAMVAGIAALALAGGWFVRQATLPGPTSVPPSRLAILAPGVGGAGGAGLFGQLAITPDGSAVIYVSIGSDQEQNNPLMLQRLDATEPSVIPGSGNLFDPEISPDGRWLLLKGSGTQRATGTYRLPIEGGVAEPISDLGPTVHTAWHPDGSLWFTRSPFSELARLTSLPGSGTELKLSNLPGLRLQQIVNRNTAIVVQAPTGSASGPCFAMNLESGQLRSLVDGQVTAARYTAGYLVFARPNGDLLAMAFDPEASRASGTAVTVGTGVSITGNGDAQFAVSTNGTVAYIPEEPRSLVFVDTDGTSRLATAAPHNFHAPQFSPDGRRIAVDFTSTDGRDVWILDLDQGTLSRATFDRDGHDATWTPDGRHITYTTLRHGPVAVYRVRPGSGAPAESLLASPTLGYTGLWLRDGTGLVTVANETRPGTRTDIAIVRNGGRGPIEAIVATPFQDRYPNLSKDGRWLAYVSDQSGRHEVYVRPLAGDGDQVQVTVSGGDEPVWSRDGTGLFYRSLSESGPRLEVADIATSPTFRVTGRKTLFSAAEFVPTNPHASYDVSPDGKTFVMVRRSPASRIMIIQNLPELVRRSITSRAAA